MALRMASPWKHPKTGMYWYRRRVPKDLQPLVGKTIVQRTLDTKDPNEAKRRYLPVAATVEREWERLRALGPDSSRKPESLSPKQLHGLAGEFYRWMVGKHSDDPGRAAAWRAEIEEDMRRIRPSGRRPSGSTGLYLPRVQKFLEERGILIDEGDMFDLAQVAAQAGTLAKERIVRMAEHDWSDDPAEGRFPKWAEVESTLKVLHKELTLDAHFDEFARTKKPSSRKKYRGCLFDLERFLKSKDLGLAKPEQIQAWVKDLESRKIGEGENAPRKIGDKNIREGYLSAARSFYRWAVKQKIIKSNPAEDIEHEVLAAPKTRKPYFNDLERELILSEALRPPSGRESQEFKDAKRWVPWLCAYTGARVNEITQLRGIDIEERKLLGETVWTIHITPEAGNQKTDEAREVPLHPHLVEQGFPEFARRKGEGPLFYSVARQRGASDENPLYMKMGGKVAEWVRKIGVPRGVAPNHGWRHYFNAVARRVHMVPEIRDAITGHAPRTEGEVYGGYVEWDMMWPAINLLPRFEVAPATGPLAHTEARKKATKDRAATRKRARERAKAAKAAE